MKDLSFDPAKIDLHEEHIKSMSNEDTKWIEFKNYMYQLHEMQDEGCRGCERPTTDCRECMQKYYWDNISYYLKYGLGG